jgi:hypothetical protein
VDALRVNFDRKLKLEFNEVKVTSDAGLSADRVPNYEILLEGRNVKALLGRDIDSFGHLITV